MTLPKSNPMLWVGYPRSYTPGRNRAPKLIVWHHTAGSEGPKSAEAGAAYDKTRLDGTSCHAFFDSEGPGLQEVPFGDRAHTAFFYGNEIGVHFELCGTLQTREQWLDPISLATLRTAAVAGRYTGEVLGIEPRRLSDAEVRRAWDVGDVTGHCDHWAITRVFGLGNHTDVGPYFPWDVFMPMIRGEGSTPTVGRSDDDVYIMWDKPKEPPQPASGFLVTNQIKNGLPVIIPVSGTKVDAWIKGKMEQRWPDAPIDVPNSGAWFILDSNAPYDTNPECPPPPDCVCHCDGGAAHVHSLDVPTSTLATGPAIPTT